MKKNQNNNDNCPRCGNPWSYGSGIYCGGIIRYSEEFDHEIWD